MGRTTKNDGQKRLRYKYYMLQEEVCGLDPIWEFREVNL